MQLYSRPNNDLTYRPVHGVVRRSARSHPRQTAVKFLDSGLSASGYETNYPERKQQDAKREPHVAYNTHAFPPANIVTRGYSCSIADDVGHPRRSGGLMCGLKSTRGQKTCRSGGQGTCYRLPATFSNRIGMRAGNGGRGNLAELTAPTHSPVQSILS